MRCGTEQIALRVGRPGRPPRPAAVYALTTSELPGLREAGPGPTFESSRTHPLTRDSDRRITLTADGARRLEALSELHLEEVPRLANTMRAFFANFDEVEPVQLTVVPRPRAASGLEHHQSDDHQH
jgi:hypothetical protein